MKRYLDYFVAMLLGVASVAVTLVCVVFLVNQKPYASKADIAGVQQAAHTAVVQTHREQAKQDVASAVVAGVVDKHAAKLKSADEQIRETSIAVSDLYKRVDAMRKVQTAQQAQINALRGWFPR